MTYTVKKPLSQFEFWSGAKERTDHLTIEQLDRLDDLLSEAMEWNETDNTPSDTTINDLFWFEDDYIAQLFGFKNWKPLSATTPVKMMTTPMKMKLDPVYPEIVARMTYFKDKTKDSYPAYLAKVKAKHEYHDLLTRVSWDVLRCCFTPAQLCDWYDQYNCNNTHITTAARKAYLEVFGNPENEVI